jgi:hypothetical protein
MRCTNARARSIGRPLHVLPPILAYTEDTHIAPWRFQPLLAEDMPDHHLEDLSDLDQAARTHEVLMIVPRPPEMDRGQLLTPGTPGVRPLLPRRYRNLLRKPYVRAAVVTLVAVATILGAVWIMQLRQSEAVAAGRLHSARHALESALDGAARYGVDPRLLASLRSSERVLGENAPPGGLLGPWGPGVMRASWYRRQAAEYSALLGAVRRLERSAMMIHRSHWSRVGAEVGSH